MMEVEVIDQLFAVIGDYSSAGLQNQGQTVTPVSKFGPRPTRQLNSVCYLAILLSRLVACHKNNCSC